MIAKFSQESGLNPVYSKLCLEENGGDYNKAGQKFLEVKSGGGIPADAWLPGRAP